jgi:hypothetical protein
VDALGSVENLDQKSERACGDPRFLDIFLIADMYRRPKPIVRYLCEITLDGSTEERGLGIVLRLFHSEHRQQLVPWMARSNGQSTMTRARGQPSRILLNREFPHQVLVLSENVVGKMLDEVFAFHTSLGIPTTTRSIRKDDRWYSLYCFADEQHAVSFQMMFGGELIA